jgi:hypothetical protein
MRRPSDDRFRNARFQVLLEAENLVIGAILLLTAAFGLRALLFYM